MSATVDRAGDFRAVPGKTCPGCQRVGEWPGLRCPDCRATPALAPAPPTPAPTTLDELASIANRAHKRIHLAGRDLIEHAIRAGDALLKARARVPHGEWIDWATEHLDMHITTAYRYMRIAEHQDRVLASDAQSIETAIQLLADLPRRGTGPRGYSDADKADWIKLADQIGIKPAARALGVSPSTMHKWTSPNSPARGQTRRSREITQDRIERAAAWLMDRFGGDLAAVRVDAARLLAVVFEVDEFVPANREMGKART